MTSEVQAAIGELVEGRPLDPERLSRALGEIMDGQSTDARTAAFLVALRLRGETVEQLIAAARTLRARAITAPARPSTRTQASSSMSRVAASAGWRSTNGSG